MQITTTDVAKHNTPTDCWMIFEGKVYDIPQSHLTYHVNNQEFDISSWCGTDITTAFTTKAGLGSDHSRRAYNDLSSFLIGDVSAASTTGSITTSPTTGQTSKITDTITVTHPIPTEHHNPYNFWAPALITLIAYLIYWRLTKINSLKKYKAFNPHTFHFTFNTFMLMGLIPSFGFGIFMIARYSFPRLNNLHFNFLYWHVELSVAFATLLVTHFMTRYKLYKAPLNLFRRRRVVQG